MSSSEIRRYKTISDFHKWNQLPPPEHPLISLVDYSQIRYGATSGEIKWTQSYYTISLKRNVPGKFRYGQQTYDFDEGLMTFFSPDQVIAVELVEVDYENNPPSGWILAIHPDFLFGSNLAQIIKKHPFFKYAVNEALFLSEKEEVQLLDLFQNIKTEYQANLDQFSQQIVINQLELLLSYSERFYQRQFLTRKKANHQLLDKLEVYLDDYFDEDLAINQGLPSVHDIADELTVSPDYLSSMLKSITGQTTQQHIHNCLIEKAKVKLSVSNASVSEIAYSLGFEHPQSFSKFFKSKTKQTPLEYRVSFN